MLYFGTVSHRRKMMEMLNMNQTNFVNTVSRSGIVVVDCWASWCGACERFSAIYESVAARYPDLMFTRLETDAEIKLVSDLGIEAIPTLMVFRDGIPVFCQTGNYTEPGLIDIVEQVKALDMETVRRQLAAEEAPAVGAENGRMAGACN
jgi:thioredoxin 1